MDGRTITISPCILNKGFSSKFPESHEEAPDQGQRRQWLKNCDNNNKDEDDSLNVNNCKYILILYTVCRHVCRLDLQKAI